MSTLLFIPLEIRLIIYDYVLRDHRDRIVANAQPSNDHLLLLDACRQIEHEAGELAGFRTYLSLRHELEISAFLDNPDTRVLVRITHLDVANDGRVIQHPRNDEKTPVSRLHRVLEKLPSLQALRVFDCNTGIGMHALHVGNSEANARAIFSFEPAMFPSGKRQGLTSYELFVAPNTKVVALQSVSGESIRHLRLSGLVRLDDPFANLEALQHLTIYGVTGNYFDSRVPPPMENVALRTFQYGQGDRLGFEMRTAFLKSVLSGSHISLTKLVLLQCSKISTNGLATCLSSLRSLEYFALSFISVNELQANFIEVLPPSVRTIKLKITHARWSFPFYMKEHVLCDGIADWMAASPVRGKVLRLFLPHIFGNSLEEALSGNTARGGDWAWSLLATKHGVDLEFGDWEELEAI